MKFYNPKKTEFFLKKLLGLSDAFLLERRAKRYLKKSTEKEIRILNQLVDSNKASIDIGVYRGVYSYFLSDLTKYVYAFEANSLLHSKLISSFVKKTNVKIENLAVSSSLGKTEIRIPIRNSDADYDYEQKYELGIATIHKANQLQNKPYETISSINKTTLDDYKFHHDIGFIKIDVEGHELEIIRGGKNFLKNHKPTMLVEIEERHSGKNPKEIITEICEIGYCCFTVDQRLKLVESTDFSEFKQNNFVFKPI